MTAEIAVLNKSSVTLAADSAVTIGRGASAKIYTSVNKIFELHETAPVGIMVYGRLDFMGLPIETVIKQYRKELGSQTFGLIEDYKHHFIQWLSSEIDTCDRDEAALVRLIILDILQKLNTQIDNAIFDRIVTSGKYLKSKDNAIAISIIKSEISKIKRNKLLRFAQKKGYQQALEIAFTKSIDDAVTAFSNKIKPSENTRKLFRQAVFESLKREALSSFRTGVVIAGFGEKEVCPSLARFEMEGILAGQLKYVNGVSLDIGRHGPHADVLGFAQSDMIDRFLHGADEGFLNYAKNMVRETITVTAKEILAVVQNTTADKVVLPPPLVSAINNLQREQAENMEKYKKKVYSDPILDMIRHMPKQECANLAKALIDLTSLKRKVSREQETVGGEVDVAVISKSEGFVWVKRKHYFPTEINPRFSARHYRFEGA